MNLLLAQTTPTPVELAAWLACLVAVAAGINQVMRLIDRMKGNPPAHEIDAKTGALSARITELEKQAVEGVERRRAIYDKMEANRQELDGKITKLGEKVEDLPSKLVALLRNTGVIH